MSASPQEPNAETEDPPGGTTLDAALHRWIGRFRRQRRLDGGSEELRRLLRDRLAAAGIEPREARLLEVNLFGSLSSWMEFALAEQALGRNVVPDFARHLRNAFLTHCRQQRVNPEVAVAMAIELATSLMDLACQFRRHLNLAPDPDGPPPAAGDG